MSFAVEAGQKIVFAGDSITDCGRRTDAAPLGRGYVAFVNDLINARYPALQPQIVNVGIGGNTVRDLFNRWEDDVIRQQPDWLSVKVGINDLHTFLREDKDRAVSPEQFSDLYENILSRAMEKTSAKLILIDPFYISQDTSSPSWRAQVLGLLPRYTETVQKLAEKYEARHVKVHELFQEQLQYRTAEHFCPEPVHPYANGHLLIAHAWLNAMAW